VGCHNCVGGTEKSTKADGISTVAFEVEPKPDINELDGYAQTDSLLKSDECHEISKM